MFNRYMITAATAALIAGTGFANAQGSMGREAPSGGAGMQQSAPSSPSATTSKESAEPGMKSSQSEEKGAVKNQRAQQDMKPGAMGEKSTGEKSAGEKSAQDTKQDTKGEKSKSMSSQNEKGATGKDMKAEDQERRGNMKAEGRDNNSSAGAKEEGRSTVGQASAGAKLSTEQRTRITTVIRDQHVAPVTNINFSVSIGTRVPREVGFHPLPTEIVTIYPEWRGYEFFLVRDQIVVVDPRTLEIVAVLDA